ncbi:MAG: hypothetical protein FD155_559 [Bacteroidetes bacterium]|nr:MAG: hypothetical protein FD155_559 [Bacteroidota bacterium]
MDTKEIEKIRNDFEKKAIIEDLKTKQKEIEKKLYELQNEVPEKLQDFFKNGSKEKF